jgi:PD-(D/E)XK nuclease superfamily
MTDLTIASKHLQPPSTQSPFLPGTQIQFAWNSTCLDLLKRCPRLYQYTVVEGWTSRDESIHLRFGIEYHAALQDYAISRARGIRHEDAIHDTIRSLHSRVWDWQVDRTLRAGKYKNRESIVSLVVDYLDHFVDDPAETYILGDGSPAVELSFRLELDWGPKAGTFSEGGLRTPYLLCGHLDRIVNFADNLYVMDHKTSMSTLSGYYFSGWSPSNQMTLYTYAGNIVLHTPVKGVIISAAQIKLTEPNVFERGFTYRTSDQLSEWTDDLRFWLGQAEAFATAGYWPQNDTSCSMFGGCKFREVCSKSPQVRETYLSASFDKIDPIESAVNPFFDRSSE